MDFMVFGRARATAIESLFKRDFNMAKIVIVKTKEIIYLEKEAVISSRETEME